MLRKILCLAISATIALGITACGSGGKLGDSGGSNSIVGSTDSSGNNSIANTDNSGSSSADNSESGSNTVTISALKSDRFLEAAIEKYKEIRPDITVELKTYAAAPESAAPNSSKGAAGGKTALTKNQIVSGLNDPKDIEKYVSTLNTEIMTGKAPDIISVDPLPYEKYADKKLLADLNAIIEADQSFDIGEYYGNIMDSVKYKGSLYAIPIRYGISMLTGDKTLLDDPSTGVDFSKWTWQDFKELSQRLIGSGSQSMSALANVSELELLKYVMGSSYDKFIDMENRKADFNNAEFQAMLNFCKELIDEKLVDIRTEEVMTNRGNTLFSISNVNMPTNFLMFPQMRFNGSGKLYQLPDNSGLNGIPFSSDLMLSINNNSKNQKEAWEFIKFLLSGEMQTAVELMGFPVHKEATEESVRQLNEKLGSGKVKMAMGGPEGQVELKPVSDEDITAMVKALENVNRYDGADREILSIILEEANSFFKGQKPVEAVTDLIQSRISMYLSE